MEKAKKSRKAFRFQFTKLETKLVELIEADTPDLIEVGAVFKTFEGNRHTLETENSKMYDLLLEEDASEQQLEQEISGVADYSVRYERIKTKVQKLLIEDPVESLVASGSVRWPVDQKRFKLPKIELKKFSGDLKEWIGFWAQFSKIHEDDGIHASDKFQYLVQSMVPNSKAKELVDSYPQSSGNYGKVIEALKERFGKEELLVEVYVRELLRLVLANVNAKGKVNIGKLYDQVESKLRSMETLGVTCENCNNILLYPLVESCLPEELLKVWQRRPKNEDKAQLEELLEFLRSEVINEEKLALAREGFQSSVVMSRAKKDELMPQVATAAGLTSQTEVKLTCVFCDKSNHHSKDCFKAKNLSNEDKMKKLRDGKRCYVCLSGGHISAKCKSKLQCLHCSKRHYIVMCPDVNHKQQTSSSSQRSVANQDGVNMASQQCNQTIQLQTLWVRLIGGNGKTKVVRVLLDSGAQRSSVSERVAAEMLLVETGTERLYHTVYGGSRTAEKLHKRFKVVMEGLHHKFRCNFETLDEEKICGSIPQVVRGPWLDELESKGVFINDVGHGAPDIDILIASDVFGKLLTGNICQLSCGLTAMETKLGWTLFGKVPVTQRELSSLANVVTTQLTSLSSMVDLWDLEAIGIKDPAEVKSKQELEQEAKSHFLNTVKKDQEGRYEVQLPWTTESATLCSNEVIATKRLMSSTQKLRQNQKYDAYGEIFDQWLQERIIEEVPEDELSKLCHYLPHRPVFKEESLTTKIRPVFDASCCARNHLSLNDCLEKGPNILELIPSILLRFREGKIGVISDIRKAFLQIGIYRPHRDYLRFLWWSKEDHNLLKVFRHRRVVFGVNCSPFLLGAVIDYHLSMVNDEDRLVAEKLRKSLYVDNCVTSVNTVADLEKFKDVAVRVMMDAKMDLRMWEHSAVEVNGIGSSVDDGCGLLAGSKEDSVDCTTVLGMKWNKGIDTIGFKLDTLELPQTLTKRIVLSSVQKLFDPMGFLSPLLLAPKLVLQEAWERKIGWDQELPMDLATRFLRWARDLEYVREVEIPRMLAIQGREGSEWSLHTFVDASKDAYAGAVFLRCETPRQVSVQLLVSKSRVAPVKKTTIPRLELLACVIGSRLTRSVCDALTLNIPIFLWSDSRTALAWIKRTENWGVFVGNRVKEIRGSTNADDWRHVPGIHNPADLPSRGCDGKQLLQSKWWEGPGWLKLGSSHWPFEFQMPDEEAVSSERKKSVLVNVAKTDGAEPWYVTRCSSYTRAVCLTARMLQWKRYKRGKEIILTAAEVTEAEQRLLRCAQDDAGVTLGKFSTLKLVKWDDDVYRVETKIVNRPEARDFRYPILLTADMPIVKLLVRQTHLDNAHAGVQTVMSILRERFWIVRSRQVVKKIVSSCVRCRRFTAKKMTCETAVLPSDRVRDANVFEVTGVDLAGPLYLKGGEKIWFALFTCGVYRAVHLELVSALSTESFLQAFQRFLSRRNRPEVVYSDQGTNFIGMANLLKKLDWKKLEEAFKVRRIQWKLNPPASPWWGGWWERLVRIVKGLLVRILGNRVLNYVELNTVMCEAENVVNSRPLTYISEDGEDLVPLTPNSFLKDSPETGSLDLDHLEGTAFQRRFAYRKKLKGEFRDRFRKEYLSQLVQQGQDKTHDKIQIGSIVLIDSGDRKKIDWPMGKIVDVMPGRDGVIRVVRLKTQSGVLTRPVQKLYPLEVEFQAPCISIAKPKKPRISKTNQEENTSDCDRVLPLVTVRTRSGREVKVPNWFQSE